MKRVLALLLCVALAGCGGEDDIQPVRDALNDTSNAPVGPAVPSNPNNPSIPTPDSDSLWEYSQNGSSRFAEIRSLNTVPTENEFNDAIMTIQIQKFTATSGEVLTTLRIQVFFAETACDMSCNIRIKKNGRPGAVYPAREITEGLFTNDSFSTRDLDSLIKDVTVSNNASLTLPLADVSDAEFLFDFSGYDTQFMR